MWKCKCGETNPDSSDFCQSCGERRSAPTGAAIKERQPITIEYERKKQEEIQKQHQAMVDNLQCMNLDGYYEYKVISLMDESGFFRKKSGTVDTEAMTKTLNELGREGWHLVTAYSNELGKNALSGGVGGSMLGVNSTVDENILIFERFVTITDKK